MTSTTHTEADRCFCGVGEIIGDRFRVKEPTGEGTFSNCYTCIDLMTHQQVVIKASRNKSCYTHAAKEEIKTMERLSALDPYHFYFVGYIGSLIYNNHVCLVFEKLGQSLYSALRFNRYQPFNVDVIRHIMWKVVNAVDILHRNKIVHTDLKLENILLKGGLIDPNGYDHVTHALSTDVRLIDFGSTDSGTSWHRHLVTTRHYRAPEILLGLKWGYECDIWSLGCIMVELAVGRIDFDAQNLIEHLFLIQEMIGQIPQKMWKDNVKEELRHIASHGNIQITDLPAERRPVVKLKPTLQKILSFHPDLCDLILKMLNPNPDKRPRTDTILCHDFFGRFILKRK